MKQTNFSELSDSEFPETQEAVANSYTKNGQSVEDLPFQEIRSLPSYNDIEYGELFSFSLDNNTVGLTHGLHRFPAKYIPQVPRWALQQFGSKATVLDPFMGSGTTLVEGLLHPGRVIGVDIDPLACLIARAKTEVPASIRIMELGSRIKELWRVDDVELQPPMPGIDNFDHWFTDDAWRKLQSLKSILLNLDCSKRERRFLLVVFSSIVRWVSNADDQSQKTYVSGTNPKKPPETMSAFWRSYNRALEGLRLLEFARHPDAKATVSQDGNARSLAIQDNSVDLIVTSPPYLDSVDYMYNFMLEYFWLGSILGVPDRVTFNHLRHQVIGAKHPDEVPACLPQEIRELVKLDRVPAYRQKATLGYFEGMKAHFQEAGRVVRPDGRYVLVVGNSRTKDDVIPLHDCLLRMAASAGFELEKAFGYRLRRHYMKFPRKGRGGIILVDWIVVMRKVSGVVPTPQRLPMTWATIAGDTVAY